MNRTFLTTAFVVTVAGLLTSNGQADLVSKYDANVGVDLDGDVVIYWADQVGGYDLDDSGFPLLMADATPSGSAAIDFDPGPNTYLAGPGGPGSGFPLAAATTLTAAVVFSPDEVSDNDLNNANFWGHPQLASGDQGGGHPDWGFSWGPDASQDYKIWFGVGEDTGSPTPTTTASGAEPSGEGNTDIWYVGVGTWDGDEGVIGVYLYDQNGDLIDSSTMDTPFATVPRVDVGFSTGAERPNLAARNLNGQIAVIELYDNWVDEAEANAIAAAFVENYLGGSPGLQGDYNGNGVLDAEDLDLQADKIGFTPVDPAYDLNSDGVVNIADREVWVNDLKNTWIGDANLNGEFNSSDMVQVFARGKYEKQETAGWEDGDWNGDTFFSSGDMVAAFVAGGYEKGQKEGGPNPAVNAVPEPGSWWLLMLAVVSLLPLCRRI